ncbi:MAG: hypothetical protein ACOX5P_00555 [Bacilli bacterium]
MIDAAALIAAAPALMEAGIITGFQLGREKSLLYQLAYRNDEDIFPVANIEFGPKAYYADDALKIINF